MKKKPQKPELTEAKAKVNVEAGVSVYRIEFRRKYYRGMWHTNSALIFNSKSEMEKTLKKLKEHDIYEFRVIKDAH